MTDEDEDRDVLRPTPDVEYRPVPGFPGHRAGSDLSVWVGSRRIKSGRVFGASGRFVRLRFGGREHVRSVALLYRAAFSRHPELWVERLRPKPRAIDAPPRVAEPATPVPVAETVPATAAVEPAPSLVAVATVPTRQEPPLAPGSLGTTGAFYERSGRAVLVEADVIEARRLRREGWSYAKLADRYGVSAGTMLAAASGKTWRNVPMD